MQEKVKVKENFPHMMLQCLLNWEFSLYSSQFTPLIIQAPTHVYGMRPSSFLQLYIFLCLSELVLTSCISWRVWICIHFISIWIMGQHLIWYLLITIQIIKFITMSFEVLGQVLSSRGLGVTFLFHMSMLRVLCSPLPITCDPFVTSIKAPLHLNQPTQHFLGLGIYLLLLLRSPPCLFARFTTSFASWTRYFVGLSSPSSTFMYIVYDITPTLGPRSQRGLHKYKHSIRQWRVNFLGSSCLIGSMLGNALVVISSFV